MLLLPNRVTVDEWWSAERSLSVIPKNPATIRIAVQDGELKPRASASLEQVLKHLPPTGFRFVAIAVVGGTGERRGPVFEKWDATI